MRAAPPATIKTVIEKIDSDPSQDQTVATYYLKNAQAANVQNVINTLYGTSTTGGRTGICP